MITLILFASIKIMLMMMTMIKLMITPKEQRSKEDERMNVRVKRSNQPTNKRMSTNVMLNFIFCTMDMM